MTNDSLHFHPDVVVSSVRNGLVQQDIHPQIHNSWKRSLDQYNLDPGRKAAPRILTGGRLRDHQEPLEPLLRIAKGGLEKLFHQIRDAGYVVLLTDTQGVTVDFHGHDLTDRELRKSGLYLGSCWAEADEGTCAVGTCIIEKTPITVHQQEHFRTISTTLTCSAAPIIDSHGNLMAVLDASALYSPDDKRSQHLLLQLVNSTARMIENAYFLKQYEDKWIVRLSSRSEFIEVMTDALLALDDQGRVVAVNQSMRNENLSNDHQTAGKTIEELFDIRFDELIAKSAAQEAPIQSIYTLHSRKRYYVTVKKPTHSILVTQENYTRRLPTIINPGHTHLTLEELAGQDQKMTNNVNIIRRVNNKGIAIMLQGETGTGKEVFASAIHHASNRAAGPFVALNCAAIPETLIESELFGYKEGAFTGAKSKGMRGKIIQAHGGTLFLDEIGDMPLQLQTRLLRVLAEKEILPLGSEKSIPVDVQIICATHRNLLDKVIEGSFREDLYYRLNGIKIELSPLRKREDMPTLIRTIFLQEARDMGHQKVTISDDALNVMLAYHWPGNIRQLINIIRAALAMSDDGNIQLENIPTEIHGTLSYLTTTPQIPAISLQVKHPNAITPMAPATSSIGSGLNDEHQQMLMVLKKNKWHISKAAKELGMSRSTIYRKMEKYKILAPNAMDDISH